MKKTLASLPLFHAHIDRLRSSTRETLQARIDAAKVVLDQIMAAKDTAFR
jgi:hypothetical protein